MKTTPFLPLVMLSSMLIAISTTAQPQPLVGKAQEISMRFQETASSTPAEFQLHFSGYHDTRCAADVKCIAAGEANALFWLSGPDIKPQVLSLRWSGKALDWRYSERVGKYEFVLISLEPRPLRSKTVAPTEYKAVVAVRLGLPTKTPSTK
jgi:hypothetical protein